MEQILFYLRWIIFVIYIIFNIGFIHGCATRARSKGGVNYGTVATTMLMTAVTIIFINTDLNKLNLLWIAPLIVLTSPINMVIFSIPILGDFHLRAVKAFLAIIMSVPYILIAIFALIGLSKWGFQGFIVGLGIGYLASLIVGIILIPISNVFDIGVIKKQYRKAIAADFISQYKDSILTLKKFQPISEDKIIDKFARFINDIQHATMKIKDPVKRCPSDCDYAGYRDNFVRGGKSWVGNFNEEDENKLMQKYVDFCETAIYENFNKYAQKGKELCYQAAYKDSSIATIKIRIDGEKVNGYYNWIPAEKDSHTGPFVGRLNKEGIIEAIHTASGEGATNDEILHLKIVKNKIFIRSWEQFEKKDGEYVFPWGKLSFLPQVECAKLK